VLYICLVVYFENCITILLMCDLIQWYENVSKLLGHVCMKKHSYGMTVKNWGRGFAHNYVICTLSNRRNLFDHVPSKFAFAFRDGARP